MNLRTWAITTAVCGVLMTAGAAEAKSITYVGDYSSSGLEFSITTDGTIGDVDDHILGFSVTSSAFADGSFNNTNGSLVIEPTSFEDTEPAFTASATGLSFDFDGENDVFMGGNGPTNGDDLLYMQVDGSFTPGTGFFVSGSTIDDQPVGTLIPESGVQTVATAEISAAPEPSAWALMVGGVALVGMALRLRSRPQELANPV